MKISNQQQKSLFLYLVLTSIVARIGFISIHNLDLLRTPYNHTLTEKEYQESQWTQSQNVSPDVLLDEWAIQSGYTGWKNYEDEMRGTVAIDEKRIAIIQDKKDKGISDSTLYAYAGYKYVTGTSPHLLNPEHPPFAKYLIGWSIQLFGNTVIGSLVVGVLLLVVVGWFTYIITHSYLRAAIAALLVSSFSLFKDQLINGPQLELYQALFVLLFLSFHTVWLKNKNRTMYIFASIVLGLGLSTKTLLPFLTLFGIYILAVHFISFSKNKQYAVISSLFLLGAAGLVFVLTYLPYFSQGNSLRSFLGLQKYIVMFYQTSSIPLVEFFGNYIRLITTGSWKFWDEARTVSQYSAWDISWPLLTILSCIASVRSFMRYTYLVLFLFLYHAFLFVTPIFPRYLLLLFIPSIIIIVSTFGKKQL